MLLPEAEHSYINPSSLPDKFHITIQNTNSLGSAIALSNKTVSERMSLYIDLLLHPATQKLHRLLEY